MMLQRLREWRRRRQTRQLWKSLMDPLDPTRAAAVGTTAWLLGRLADRPGEDSEPMGLDEAARRLRRQAQESDDADSAAMTLLVLNDALDAARKRRDNPPLPPLISQAN